MKSRTTRWPTTSIRSATPSFSWMNFSPSCQMGNLFDFSAMFVSHLGRIAVLKLSPLGQLTRLRGQSNRGRDEGDKARQRLNTAEKAFDGGVRRQIDIPLGRTGDVAIDRDVGD